jgi:diaphanous 1
LGLKDAKRSAMYALSPERKKFLLQENRQFKSRIQHPPSNGAHATYSASYGPSSAAALLPKLVPQLTGDAGLIRRLSIVGWASATAPAPPVTSSDTVDTNGEFNNLSSPTNSRVAKSFGDELPPLQPQSTGSMWSSWWTSSGGEKPSSSDKDAKQEFAKSARWYIDGLRVGKTPDMKLVKHLITLRVHLSTAKLTFVQEFVGAEKGLIALGTLLANLVGKGGKKKNLNEVETTVLLEVLKCLRVLLNTSVRRVVYSLELY